MMLMCSETAGSKPFQCSTVPKKMQDRLLAEFRDLRQELEEDNFFFRAASGNTKMTRQWFVPSHYPMVGRQETKELGCGKCLQFLAYGVPNCHPAQKTETEKFSTPVRVLDGWESCERSQKNIVIMRLSAPQHRASPWLQRQTPGQYHQYRSIYI